MSDEVSTKQQIVEKIKSCSNILVTVSTDPSVDELSAALGLTILLNKLGKHATSVVSGNIPPAIDFLEPGKTFENTADSLRDFIIALDKEKADHLRYKVEGDVVKIFITPYRTTITSDDLDFSQGDYNVELVLALGVKDRDHLDKALSAHGRILHDATVATISLAESSQLGSIDWQDSGASSYSEMLVALSESLKGDKPLLDEQIANAFLTGIVASTDRFSNNLTSPRVMTMAAQLMAAGANQQLIAAKLEDAEEITIKVDASSAVKDADVEVQNSDGTTTLAEGESTKLEKESQTEEPKAEEIQPEEPEPEEVQPKAEPPKKNDGTMVVEHEEATPQEQPVEQPQSQPEKLAEELLAEDLSQTIQSTIANGNTLSVADLQADLANASKEVEVAAEQSATDIRPVTQPDAIDGLELSKPAPRAIEWQPPTYEEAAIPTFGGTLNATTEAAAEEKKLEEANNRNKSILHHNGGKYMASNQPPIMQSPLNGTSMPSDEPTINPFTEPSEQSDLSEDTQPTAYAADVKPLSDVEIVGPIAPVQSSVATLADLDSLNRAPAQNSNDARTVLDDAFNSAPFAPAYEGNFVPELPLPPSIPPDFSSLPPLPPSNFGQPAQIQSSPDLPPDSLGDIFGADQASSQPMPPPPPNDPGQFRIPGQ